jgi:hypothetical protein
MRVTELGNNAFGHHRDGGRMSDERDEYDVFLDTWQPSERLEHATLPSNLFDPLAQTRLLEDSTGAAKLDRTPYQPGPKVLGDCEKQLRAYAFFETNQSVWSADFRDRVLEEGVNSAKFDQFVHCFATHWVDGATRRQASREMMAIKASIRDHDRQYHRKHADRYVISRVPDNVAPLFDARETQVIFRVNEHLLETVIPDYLAEIEGDRGGSINFVSVRRGVRMPAAPGPLRQELHYLSSYSLALGPVEQFAQTWTDVTKDNGLPSVFSAPLPAIQTRVVAFAPFIAGMDLRQLELVVAPPVEPCQLTDKGSYGGIREYEFN